MAEAAVEFLLENLKQLLIHHADLIKNARSQVEKLEQDVGFFKSFLKKVSSKKLRQDHTLKALVREIRGVIYDADDAIDTMVTQAAEKKTRKYIPKFVTLPSNHDISNAERINEICSRITHILNGNDKFNLLNFSTADDGPDEDALQPTPSKKDNVVGLEDEANKIVGYLKENTSHLDVISIIGMPGLGKTTLAGKIFHDPDIKYEFTTRVWVYVSQEFTEKEVFLSILRQMKTQFNEEEYTKKRCSDLAKETSALLGEVGKFLLVMDDVWETKDWDKIKECLPEDNTRGKVMITSRQMDVGKHVNRFREPHPLRKLDLDESCELLQWEVFKKPEFPRGLKRVGREIAAKCDGLPLAIVVLGGVLATKFSKTETQWEIVSTSVSTFLGYDSEKRMEKIIALSYERLPYHLKECFLYMGMFPEDCEIPAWKLIRMWIAEGLIQPKDGITMEEVAGYNLDDLINRNLVMAAKLKADGRVKSCRIHDMLRDFCKVEGGKDSDNFYQEIKWSSDEGLQPSVTEAQKHRRLCIHSHVMDFFGKGPEGPYVRSFVTFSEDIEVPLDKIAAICSAFKLLRVLEAKPLKFSRLPKDFHELFHLRYLALSMKPESNSTPSVLPSTFKKLWNIQTLIVDTTSRSLDIRADVMSMTQLRHLKTNACTTIVKPGKESKEGEKLQSLSTVSPESCTEALFDRARNLKKLGIRGKLSSFLNSKTGTFDCLTKLSYLEKLKLLNDVYPKPPSLGKLDSLPPAYKFPVNLRSLTLQNTYLEWTHMSTLGSLQKLKVLKLKDKAFVGTTWEVMERGFNALEVLHIRRTDLLTWTASAQHFPSLKQLQLHNCEKLKEVPIGLADNPNLECLDVHFCVEAAASAMKLAAAKKAKTTTFTLSIFPPCA